MSEDKIENALNHIKELYSRIDSLKNEQLNVNQNIFKIQGQLIDNKKDDIENERRFNSEIKNMAKNSGGKAGRKNSIIVSVIIGIVATILEKIF